MRIHRLFCLSVVLLLAQVALAKLAFSNDALGRVEGTLDACAVTQQNAEAEGQLAALDAETTTMQGLLEETQNNIVDLVKAWRNGNAQQRQELAFSLYPDGLVYSRELRYFEPRNVLLMQAMIAGVLSEENIGAPPVQFLNHLLSLKRLFSRFS